MTTNTATPTPATGPVIFAYDGSELAKLAFVLVRDGAGTRVDITTDLQLNGAVAQYGRGVGLIKEIANQLVGQFAEHDLGKVDQQHVERRAKVHRRDELRAS